MSWGTDATVSSTICLICSVFFGSALKTCYFTNPHKKIVQWVQVWSVGRPLKGWSVGEQSLAKLAFEKSHRARVCVERSTVLLNIMTAQFRVFLHQIATRRIFKEKWAENSVSRHTYLGGYLHRVKRFFKIKLRSRSSPFSIIFSIRSVIQTNMRFIIKDNFLQINFLFLQYALHALTKLQYACNLDLRFFFCSLSSWKVYISNLSGGFYAQMIDWLHSQMPFYILIFINHSISNQGDVFVGSHVLGPSDLPRIWSSITDASFYFFMIFRIATRLIEVPKGFLKSIKHCVKNATFNIDSITKLHW